MAITSTKRRSSSSSKRNDWMNSFDVPADLLVDICGTKFNLHKFPLLSKCGRIRRLVADMTDGEPCNLQFPDIPGGPEAFELAAKFCYGVSFEINTSNVASLRCASEYLEMTEEYGQKNLVARTEVFMDEIGTRSCTNAIKVLHTCEKLFPMAEELGIVGRCIDAIADAIFHEYTKVARSVSDHLEQRAPNSSNLGSEAWIEELSILRIDLYKKVLTALLKVGVPPEGFMASLIHYAQRCLTGFSKSQVGLVRSASSQQLEHEQRILLETIVSMLPEQKEIAPCEFLFSLLRTAIILDTTLACRMELERRISSQLEQATLDDLLIPSFSYNNDTMFDVDIVHRLVANFARQLAHENDEEEPPVFEPEDMNYPKDIALMKVMRLLDNYLAEVAADANLKASKFIALAELLPDHARASHDHLYRAIDIFFKGHASLGELERKRLCKMLDIQKMSNEACAHAAQNDRLPVNFMVQVLYYEQLKIRNALANTYLESEAGAYSSRPPSGAMSPRDPYSSIRRENMELKNEVTRMRMRLSDLEKDNLQVKPEGQLSPSSRKNFLQSFIGKMNPFGRRNSSSNKAPSTPRRFRHSHACEGMGLDDREFTGSTQAAPSLEQSQAYARHMPAYTWICPHTRVCPPRGNPKTVQSYLRKQNNIPAKANKLGTIMCLPCRKSKQTK